MVISIDDIHSKSLELEKIKSTSSQLLVNAIELIDVALWLIAGSRHSQALATLHNSIELILKSELERIHRVLIADNRQLDYKSLKSLLKDAFMTHPQGKSLVIDEYDLEKTITFTEALTRAKELYPSLTNWKDKLKELQELRNDIIHYGSDENREDDYVRLIATSCFPFLESFLIESNDVALKKIIGESVYREVKVAEKVCNEIKKNGQHTFRHAFKTVRAAMIYKEIDFPQLCDKDGFVQNDESYEYEKAKSFRQSLNKSKNDELIKVICKICGSHYAFVQFTDIDDGNDFVFPHSLACSSCGLELTKSDIFLAEIHYGKILLTEVEELLKGNNL